MKEEIKISNLKDGRDIVGTEKCLFGRLSEVKRKFMNWGNIGVLFSNWEELKLNGYIVEFNNKAEYSDWADINSENLCVVKSGSGEITLNGRSYLIDENFAFKVYPGQEPIIIPNNNLKVVSVQMRGSLNNIKENGVDLSELEVVDTNRLLSKVYEFETLAKEVFRPKHSPGLGLIKFAFVNPIPVHKHPFSGRLILPISGKGVTYMEPNLYEAHSDTFALFAKDVVHTNGPIAGHPLHLYAVQLPWIESGIDHEDIAGSPKFVKYIGITPPKELWKKKEDMELLIKKLESKG